MGRRAGGAGSQGRSDGVTDLVEAIRAERRALIEPLLAPIADKLRTLDEMEHLARSLNGGGSDVPAVRAPVAASTKHAVATGGAQRAQRALPPRTRGTAAGRGGLTPAADSILTAVRSGDGAWMTGREIAAAAGRAASTLRNYLGPLCDRGLVEATGTTRDRRYRAVMADNPASGGFAPRVPAPKAASRSTTGSKLSAADRRIARARILDHCSRRRLDEQSLASTLGIGREEVADLCGELLLDDKIVLLPDGQYTVPE